VALIVVVIVRADALNRGARSWPATPATAAWSTGFAPSTTSSQPGSEYGSCVLPIAPNSDHADRMQYQSFDVAHADRDALYGPSHRLPSQGRGP
jgi:hypothetical protein